jgi:hypothetical protein
MIIESNLHFVQTLFERALQITIFGESISRKGEDLLLDSKYNTVTEAEIFSFIDLSKY